VVTRILLVLSVFVACLTATAPSVSGTSAPSDQPPRAAWSEGRTGLSRQLANVAARVSIRAPGESDGSGTAVAAMLRGEQIRLAAAPIREATLVSACVALSPRRQTRLHDAIPPPSSL
jgi:hypothetical protein